MNTPARDGSDGQYMPHNADRQNRRRVASTVHGTPSVSPAGGNANSNGQQQEGVNTQPRYGHDGQQSLRDADQQDRRQAVSATHNTQPAPRVGDQSDQRRAGGAENHANDDQPSTGLSAQEINLLYTRLNPVRDGNSQSRNLADDVTQFGRPATRVDTSHHVERSLQDDDEWSLFLEPAARGGDRQDRSHGQLPGAGAQHESNRVGMMGRQGDGGARRRDVFSPDHPNGSPGGEDRRGRNPDDSGSLSSPSSRQEGQRRMCDRATPSGHMQGGGDRSQEPFMRGMRELPPQSMWFPQQGPPMYPWWPQTQQWMGAPPQPWMQTPQQQWMYAPQQGMQMPQQQWFGAPQSPTQVGLMGPSRYPHQGRYHPERSTPGQPGVAGDSQAPRTNQGALEHNAPRMARGNSQTSVASRMNVGVGRLRADSIADFRIPELDDNMSHGDGLKWIISFTVGARRLSERSRWELLQAKVTNTDITQSLDDVHLDSDGHGSDDAKCINAMFRAILAKYENSGLLEELKLKLRTLRQTPQDAGWEGVAARITRAGLNIKTLISIYGNTDPCYDVDQAKIDALIGNMPVEVTKAAREKQRAGRRQWRFGDWISHLKERRNTYRGEERTREFLNDVLPESKKVAMGRGSTPTTTKQVRFHPINVVDGPMSEGDTTTTKVAKRQFVPNDTMHEDRKSMMSDNPKRHCASQSSRQDDEVKGFMAAVVDMNASLQRAASQITDAARELHTAKSKTESCRNWANTGTCRYGAACRFAHGDVQSVQSSPVHTAPARKRICPYHQNGHCLKGANCNYSHDITGVSKASTNTVQQSKKREYVDPCAICREPGHCGGNCFSQCFICKERHHYKNCPKIDHSDPVRKKLYDVGEANYLANLAKYKAGDRNFARVGEEFKQYL